MPFAASVHPPAWYRLQEDALFVPHFQSWSVRSPRYLRSQLDAYYADVFVDRGLGWGRFHANDKNSSAGSGQKLPRCLASDSVSSPIITANQRLELLPPLSMPYCLLFIASYFLFSTHTHTATFNRHVSWTGALLRHPTRAVAVCRVGCR